MKASIERFSLDALSVGNRHLDEQELHRWAHDRIKGLADTIDGRRDEKMRQVLACYVEEVVVKPSNKTGYMALNPATFALPENEHDRSDERSCADELAGVGFERTTLGLSGHAADRNRCQNASRIQKRTSPRASGPGPAFRVA